MGKEHSVAWRKMAVASLKFCYTAVKKLLLFSFLFIVG
jgi:hypothetical protein